VSALLEADASPALAEPAVDAPVHAQEVPATEAFEASVPNDAAAEIETKTAETMKGLFGRDSLYMLLWGVQLGIAALCTPIITRMLGVSQFGVVAATLAMVQVVVALASFSLQSAVQRAFANGDGDRDARRIVTVAVILALGMWALVDATGPLWSQALGLGRYGPALQYGVAWAALWAITNATLGLIRSQDRLFAFGIVTLLQSVVAEILGLLLVALVHRTASEYVLGHLIAQGAAVCVALIVARPLAPRRHDLPMLGGALRYSVGLVPAALASFVLDTSDRLIVHGDLGPAAVARYAVAYNVAGLTIILLYVLNSVWMPRVFALADPKVRTSVLGASRDLLYALLIPIVVGLCAASPIILSIWVPASYQPGGLLLIVAIVAVTAFPYAGMMSATRVLMFSGNTLAVGVATVVAALVNIGLNVLLVPKLGIAGAGLATFCSFSLLSGLLAIRSRRISRLPRPPAALIAKILLAATISLASTKLPMDSTTMVIRAAVTSGCLVVFVAMLTSIISPTRHPLAGRVAAVFHSPDFAVAS
jgi:O-antigen/teichoic acid export membrane protein